MKEIDIIIDETVNCLHPQKIILFGSRARGDNKRYSDFDIAFSGGEADIRNERRLMEVLDEKLGIYKVDIINLEKVEDDFRKLILEQGKVIYGQ
ncbi:MAG: nucleotidyltransferase domain-containing protein [Nitrospirae bacterium]|nr:nucleotidyltransferase domain-containing protein [Nitrospirota bacterium]